MQSTDKSLFEKEIYDPVINAFVYIANVFLICSNLKNLVLLELTYRGRLVYSDFLI